VVVDVADEVAEPLMSIQRQEWGLVIDAATRQEAINCTEAGRTWTSPMFYYLKRR
jgi:hypothetical protein